MWGWITAAGNLFALIMKSRIGGWIVAGLIWLGISITTYKFGVQPFTAAISNMLGGAGFLVNWMGFFGVDKAVTIVLSAIAAKYATGAAKVALTKSS